MTTRANQIVFGTATETTTAPGIDSASSRTSQGAVTGLVTTDASGNLAGRSAASLGLATQSQVNSNTAEINRNTTGVAGAMALTGIPSVLPVDADFAISTNVGTFGGEAAMALGGVATLTDTVFISGGGAFGLQGVAGGGRLGITKIW